MSTGFCCCWYFGEYDDKTTNDVNLNNPLLRLDVGDTVSETETEITYEEDKEKNELTESSVMPSWVPFETVNNCWECNTPFEQLGLTSVLEDVADSLSSKVSNFLSPSQQRAPAASSANKRARGKHVRNKRHHCRRCRNVFCAHCTSQRSRIVLLEMEKADDGPCKEQRVCTRCYSLVQQENLHLLERDLLLTPQSFKKHEKLGLTTKFIRLVCSADFSTLVMTTGLGGQTGSAVGEENTRRIPMGRLICVEPKSLTSFDIHWDAGEELGRKRWTLEADTGQTASRWVQLLSEASFVLASHP